MLSSEQQCSNYILAMIAIAMLCTASPQVAARPRALAKPPPQREQLCVLSDNQQYVCQKCAKITKSPLVYPMCCKNEENVFEWCEEYVNFGIH